MADINAEELLRKHLGKKNLTNKHIHIAAFTSCIDAINEALKLTTDVGAQKEQLRACAELFRQLTADERIEIVKDDYCDNCWQDEKKHGKCYCSPRYDI